VQIATHAAHPHARDWPRPRLTTRLVDRANPNSSTPASALVARLSARFGHGTPQCRRWSGQTVAELPACQSPLRDRIVLRDATNESADRQGAMATQLPISRVDELRGPAAAAMGSENIAAAGRHCNAGDGASVAIVPAWRLATMVCGHDDESDDDWL
jgi:hypothetical protein